jgi:hypothetical protein
MWVPGNPLAKRAARRDPGSLAPICATNSAIATTPPGSTPSSTTAADGRASSKRHTALQFVDGNRFPDMHGGVAGRATQATR